MMHKQQQPYAKLPSKVWPSIDFCIQMMINRCVCKCMCVRMKMFAIISTDIFASGTVLYSVVNAITLQFVYIFFLLETYTTHFPLTHAHIAFFSYFFFFTAVPVIYHWSPSSRCFYACAQLNFIHGAYFPRAISIVLSLSRAIAETTEIR